jgi:hypothetical protein
MLYYIFLATLQSTLDKAKQKYGPHAYSILGSAQRNSMDLLSNQLQQLSIQQTVASQNLNLVVPPTQMLNIHSVQLANPKSNQ